MREVRRRVAGRNDGVVETDVGKRCGLECRDVGDRSRGFGIERVPGLVEPCRSQIFAGRVPLIERLGGEHARDDIGGQGLIGFDVARVVVEHFGPQHPHFIDLARKLNEVAEDVGAREVRVRHDGEKTVERVAELMEQRADLVEREQRRLAGRGLWHVEVVDHNRLRAAEVRLADDGVHPCAAALRVTGIQVEHEQPERCAVFVVQFEDPRIGVVRGEVVTLGECHPIELVRREEHAILQHALGLEPGAQRRGVDVVLGLAYLLRVERPVVRLEGERRGFGVDNLLERCLFAAGVCSRAGFPRSV